MIRVFNVVTEEKDLLLAPREALVSANTERLLLQVHDDLRQQHQLLQRWLLLAVQSSIFLQIKTNAHS